MKKKRKVFYSLADIERVYMPNAFKERVKRLKEKIENFENEIPVINNVKEPM
jgi:hypothetical protein